MTSRLALRPELLAPNGYLHAATVIALADTACGYETLGDLPKGAESFTHQVGMTVSRLLR